MIINGYIQAGIDWKSIVQNPESLKGKFVKVFLLAKEGISNPKILGGTSKPLEWTSNSILSLYNNVKAGIQAFLGHGKTRIDNTRESIGEVVGQSIQTIGGKLQHYVALASDKDHQYNVISMEADVKYSDTPTKGIVERVTEITGLALGIKGIDIPGVEGAELIASMQFFENGNSTNTETNTTQTRKQMNDQEVKEYLRNRNPSDFFDLSKIIGKVKISENGKLEYDGEGDPKVAKIIQKYVIDPMNPKIESFNKQLEDLKPIVEEHKKLKIETERSNAKSKIDEIVKTRNLTDQHKKFLERQFGSFNPETGKLDEFVESKLTEFKGLVDDGLIKLDGTSGTNPPPPSTEDNKNAKTFDDVYAEIEGKK